MLEVGQKLYWVPAPRRGEEREVQVIKVGRVWASLDNHHRISIDNMRADGGQYSPPGRCYTSKEEYQKEVELQAAWRAFRDVVDRTHIPNATLEVIATARAMLNLD